MKDIQSYSNYEIVTIVLLSLGGISKHIDREDIAVKANEIAPGRFNWRKYPNRIDLDAVGSALRDAKKEKNGQLVVGNNTRGWMLSPNGLQWISSVRVQNPEHAVHGFRSMPSTDSGACRPLIPEQIVHYFGQPGMGGRHQMGS